MYFEITPASASELERELDLARVHPRDVEQIVEARRDEVCDLALDHLVLEAVQARCAAGDQLHRRQDRRERVAQLVTEQREELVLRAARGEGLLLEAPALDDDRDAPRELLGEREIVSIGAGGL